MDVLFSYYIGKSRLLDPVTRVETLHGLLLGKLRNSDTRVAPAKSAYYNLLSFLANTAVVGYLGSLDRYYRLLMIEVPSNHFRMHVKCQ